jgi:hypothetical protein
MNMTQKEQNNDLRSNEHAQKLGLGVSCGENKISGQQRYMSAHCCCLGFLSLLGDTGRSPIHQSIGGEKIG